MRAIKTSTISILALGLLAGSAVGVAAQDEEATTTSFTGTIEFIDVARESTDTDLGTGFTDYSGFVILNSYESSDPRFTGDSSVVVNGVMVPDSFETTGQRATTYLVTNDGGSWLGEARAFGNGETDSVSFITFVGRDGYEGQTAYAQIDPTQDPPTISGVIFPVAMPEMPEPYTAEYPHRAASAACGARGAWWPSPRLHRVWRTPAGQVGPWHRPSRCSSRG